MKFASVRHLRCRPNVVT